MTDWTSQALCAQVDPDLWFPEAGQNCPTAKSICADCPALTQCREHAINADVNLDGIWGGTSERERAAIRRKRGIKITKEARCGTEAGARRHNRRGEPACQPCLAAAALASSLRKEKRAA